MKKMFCKPGPVASETGIQPAKLGKKKSINKKSSQDQAVNGMAGSFFALEPRIMFDGAAVATGAEVSQDTTAQEQPDITGIDGETSADSTNTDSAGTDALWSSGLSLTAPSDRKEIVFIDTRVEDYQTLMEGIDFNADVILLDSTRDGVEQIAEVLNGRSDIDAIHLISHGNQAELRLGTSCLTWESMNGEYADELAIIGQALTNTGDILIYGCNFGQGELGQEAASRLAQLTGGDIAASSDETGAAIYGGNWNLELQTGAIEASLAVSQDAQSAWQGKLATITVTTTNDVINAGDGLISLREAIQTVNAGSGGDTIILPAGTYNLSLTGAGDNLAASGDLDIRNDVTIIGDSAQTTIIDGQGADRVFEILNNSDVTISDVTIQNGAASSGGGIELGSGVSLTLQDVAVTGNTATAQGGGIDTASPIVLNRVTISGNTANNGAGLSNNGGGTITMLNSTISGNTATNNGGGIFARSSVTITNSTIAFNSASSGGGIDKSGGGSVSLKNTILASNTGGNASSTLTSLGNNIDSDGTAGLGDPLDGVNPLLGALADNGGSTQTHALLGGSPAIDAGTSSGAPSVDQRGALRDANVDIGAFEASVITTPTVDLDSNNSSGATGNDYQFTFTEGDGPTAIADSDVDMTDTDSTTFTTVTLAISGLLDGNNETLRLDGDIFALATIVAGQNTSGGNYRVVITTGAGTANVTITKQGGGTFNETETETLIKAIQYQHIDATNPTDGNRLIDVTVNDGTGDGPAARTTINVNPVNAPPVAVADNSTLNEGATATLNLAGNDTDNDDGLDLTSISIVSGPANGTITAINPDGTVSYTHNGSETTSDSFTYTIRDLTGATSNTATVSLTITPTNDAPVITSNGGGTSASLSILSDTTEVTTISATDAEGAILTYSLVGGADAALFTIHPSTGVLTFNTAPDFQSPSDADGNNVYEVVVQVSDGTATDTQSLAVTVTDLPPTVLTPSPSDSGSESTLSEDQSTDSPSDVATDFIAESGVTPSATPAGSLSASPNQTKDAMTVRTLRMEDFMGLTLAQDPKSVDDPIASLVETLKSSFATTTFKSEIQSLLSSSSRFFKGLDHVRDTLNGVTATEKTYVASSIAVSTGLSVGYVIWLLRSGVLLTALLTSIPAWQYINPLLILASPAKKSRHTDTERDDVELLFDHSSDVNPSTTPSAKDTRTPKRSGWFRRHSR